MKSRFFVALLLVAWLAGTRSGFAFADTFDVTPKNQRSLKLDFVITVSKHERTFIVDFVIPPKSKLRSMSEIGVYSPVTSFASPNGLSVPFLGLTDFPRDSPTKPKEVQWVHGLRLWIGEEAMAGSTIQFTHDLKIYLVRLADYVHR